MKTLRTLITLLLIAATTITASAKDPEVTKAQQYPGMYEEKPVTIAVMPPINRTTHAEAKEYFYTTLYRPLCEKGFYVFHPPSPWRSSNRKAPTTQNYSLRAACRYSTTLSEPMP